MIFTLISINLTVIVLGSIAFRLWLRGQPDARAAQRLACGVIMWLGCLVCVAGLALTLAAKDHPAWLLVTTGLLIVVSMGLRRNELARKAGDKPKADDVRLN